MSRIGLLQLPSGISGDMFLGALHATGVPLSVMETAIRAVGGERLGLRAGAVRRGGMAAIKVDVLVDGDVLKESGGPHEIDSAPAGEVAGHPSGESHDPVAGGHVHRHYSDIDALIEKADLPTAVRNGARKTFRLLAEAESKSHGVPVESVHFHEVGSWDAIADVVGAVAGVVHLGLERLYHGPVALGGGTVSTSHGRLAVPAPATLELLRDRPCRFEDGVGELTTPTGAALVAALAEPAPPALDVEGSLVGHGAGSKDPAGRPNLARLLVGESATGASGRRRVAVIEASLDDCTPEDGGHLIRSFLAAGALDVTLTPLLMKKSRPGFLLRILGEASDGARLAGRVLSETTSLGARWRIEDRVELPRRIDRVRVPEGEVRVKVATLPDGRQRPHVEFDDLERIAETRGMPLGQLRREIERLWENER